MPRYLATFVGKTGDHHEARRLARLLKVLGRVYGLRCVDVKEVKDHADHRPTLPPTTPRR